MADSKIGESSEQDNRHCDMKCCMTRGCVAFTYNKKSKVCSLSKASWSELGPVPGDKDDISCTKPCNFPYIIYHN